MKLNVPRKSNKYRFENNANTVRSFEIGHNDVLKNKNFLLSLKQETYVTTLVIDITYTYETRTWYKIRRIERKEYITYIEVIIIYNDKFGSVYSTKIKIRKYAVINWIITRITQVREDKGWETHNVIDDIEKKRTRTISENDST